MTPEQRFWAKVDKTDGCWLWTASTTAKGYGQLQVRPGVMSSAHRYSYTIHNGVIPDGLHILHTCDNPRCVRPDHLFLGTNKDNSRDMVAKGRCNPPKGVRASNAQLTDALVRLIRVSPLSARELAETLDVTTTAIYLVRNRTNWKHI